MYGLADHFAAAAQPIGLFDGFLKKKAVSRRLIPDSVVRFGPTTF